MAIQYQAYSEKECSQLIDPGQYPFEVLDATDTDESGNRLLTRPKPDKHGVIKRPEPMIRVKLKIWDINGMERVLTDWIVLNQQWAFKLRHLCDSIGIVDIYEAQTLKVEDLIGKCGVVHIVITKSTNPAYQDSNGVKDYVKKELQQVAKQKEPEFKDDELPSFS